MEARSFRYWPDDTMIDCVYGTTKAFGFPGCSIFFEVDGEFVRNVWLKTGRVDDNAQVQLLGEALYQLGEDLEWLLVDWNAGLCIDLRDKSQISYYLSKFLI